MCKHEITTGHVMKSLKKKIGLLSKYKISNTKHCIKCLSHHKKVDMCRTVYKFSKVSYMKSDRYRQVQITVGVSLFSPGGVVQSLVQSSISHVLQHHQREALGGAHPHQQHHTGVAKVLQQVHLQKYQITGNPFIKLSKKLIKPQFRYRVSFDSYIR